MAKEQQSKKTDFIFLLTNVGFYKTNKTLLFSKLFITLPQSSFFLSTGASYFLLYISFAKGINIFYFLWNYTLNLPNNKHKILTYFYSCSGNLKLFKQELERKFDYKLISSYNYSNILYIDEKVWERPWKFLYSFLLIGENSSFSYRDHWWSVAFWW